MKGQFIDFHTHTIFSDGGLLPSELARRVKTKGGVGLVFTDHVDISNLDFVVTRFLEFVRENDASIHLAVGVELTHVAPAKIAPLAERARRLGAEWIVVHGETIVEPVVQGTNRAAVEAPVDLLAHPGLILEEDAAIAAKNGIFLEITTRKGHSLSNGHVVQTARKTGAKLLLNTDTHSSDDILDLGQRENIASGSGLDREEIDQIWRNAQEVLSRILMQRSQ